MKLPLTRRKVQYWALLAVLLLSARSQLWAQTSSSAYFPLVTARNVAVYDTLSGLNMSVLKISPQAKHGAVQINILSAGGNGLPYKYQIRYTPHNGFTGLDTFTLEVNYIGSYPFLTYRAYQVSVYPSLIKSKTDYTFTPVDQSVTVDVLANDQSNNGPLNLTSIPLVNNGTASINNQKITFTPATGFTGRAHLHYVVCDSTNYCKTEQVIIGVQPNQALPSDTLLLTIKKGKSLTFPMTVDGFQVFQAPSNGILSISGGQVLQYKPNSFFSGNDQFTLINTTWGIPFYKTVLVQVLQTPKLNVMAVTDLVYTPVGQPITLNVRSNDIGNLMVKGWSVPANLPGTISGTSSTGTVTFTPKPNFSGVATFYYKIGNMNVPDLEIAPVHVVVGNQAPRYPAYHFTTPVGTPFVLNYKIPFTAFTFEVAQAPKHGKCTFLPGFTSQTINGQLVSGNNLLIYTPVANFEGTDDFELKYCVSANGQCSTEKITMTVTEVNATEPPYCLQNCVWAGDLNNDGMVNNRDLLRLGNALGSPGFYRPNAQLEWYGQFGTNWDNPFTGATDLKYADSDGNGQITATDTAALHAFYGQTHQFTPNPTSIGKGIPFSLNLLTPNPGKGDLVRVAVSIGNPNIPVVDLYGFTFDIQLASNIVDSALNLQYLPDTWINYTSPSVWMAKKAGPGRLETAFTRTNGQAVSGSGVVAELDFIIIDIVHGGKPGTEMAEITLELPQLMDATGERNSCQETTLQIPLRQTRTAQPTVATNEDLIVYPSPASNNLNVHLNGDAFIEQLRLYDFTGKMVYQSAKGQWDARQIPVENLPSGVYLLKAQTNCGILSKKVQIQH